MPTENHEITLTEESQEWKENWTHQFDKEEDDLQGISQNHVDKTPYKKRER